MRWLLLACSECPTFEEMVVTGDETGEIALIIREFAEFTGREGVCVPAVDVVEVVEGDGDVAGRFIGPGEPIEVARTMGSYAPVVRHELCHALDAAEALADPLAGVLADVEVDTARYPDPDTRVGEAPAQVCEAGPAEVGFIAALDERCGVGLDPAAEAVRVSVYREAPPSAVVEVGADPTFVELAELGEGRVVGVAGGERGAWLRLQGLGGVAEHWWSPEGAPAEPVGTWAEGEPVARGADWAWTWYERGVAGLAAGDAEAWTLVTDCGVSTSGALSSWVGAQPAWFTEDRSPLWVR